MESRMISNGDAPTRPLTPSNCPIIEVHTMEAPSNEAEIGPETGSNIRSRL